jgi:hypothetical protein
MLFVAVHKSAYGTKRTWRDEAPMSAFEGKADISQLLRPIEDTGVLSSIITRQSGTLLPT